MQLNRLVLSQYWISTLYFLKYFNEVSIVNCVIISDQSVHFVVSNVASAFSCATVTCNSVLQARSQNFSCVCVCVGGGGGVCVNSDGANV